MQHTLMIFAKKIVFVIGLLICNILSAQNQFFHASLDQDRDALAFVNNAGINNGRNISAIFYLVKELKRSGLWQKMFAIYPMIGANATSHSYNLKDPRNSSLALRLQFNGGWSHNEIGATPNGIDGWANTFSGNLFLTLYTGNLSFGYFSQTNINTQQARCYEMGYEFAPGAQFDDSSYTTALAIKHGSSVTPVGDQNFSEGAIASSFNLNRARTNQLNSFDGFFAVSCTNASGVKLFRNGQVIAATNNAHQSFSISNIYLGAINRITGPNSSFAANFSNRTCSFAYISYGLSDNEVLILNNIIAVWQSSFRISDPDALQFINNAGITNANQREAINKLVTRLKSDGLWNKLLAVYPMVGGNATAHSYNLKGSSYLLSFFGGWTHSNTGALPNGTNAYANTSLNPASVLNQGSASMGYYSGTDNTTSVNEMGVFDNNSRTLLGIGRTTIDARLNTGVTTVFTLTISSTPTTGLYVSTKTTETNVRIFRNGSTLGNVTVTSAGPSNGSIYIGARNNNSSGTNLANNFSNRECRFAFIGLSLSDTEVTAIYNSIQQFQSDLGRAL